MPARLTVHPPEHAARSWIVPEQVSWTVGRDPNCEIVLDDIRVSKRHALLAGAEGRWRLEDLGSKNGTRINGIPPAGPLIDGDWISLGGLTANFAILSPSQLEAWQRDGRRRRHASTSALRLPALERDAGALLRRLLISSIELTGTERGFVLLLDEDGRVEADLISGYQVTADPGAAFDGSLTVLERVRRTGRTIVVTDAQMDVSLASRTSVARAGLRALAAVPLRVDGAIRGFVYVDGCRPGTLFSDLDVDILETLAEQAAIALASMALDREIRALLDARPHDDVAAGHAMLAELEARVASTFGGGRRR